MRILILGGQNKLGFQLVKSFSEDYDVFSWDKDEIDFLDFDLVKNRIDSLRPSLIVNALSYDNIDKCEKENGLAVAIKYNTELVAKLAQISLNNNAILMHYSNDQVFSGTKEKQFFLEEEIANPLNKYGETKLKGENEILRLSKKGLQYYLIRYSRLFGPPGPSDENETDFFTDLLFKYQQGKRDFMVIKEELANFTYSVDLAYSSKRIWELKMDFGIYHLVNENSVTWYEAAAEMFRICRFPVYIRGLRSEDLLKDARRAKYSVLKNEKVKKLRPYSLALEEYLSKQI